MAGPATRRASSGACRWWASGAGGGSGSARSKLPGFRQLSPSPPLAVGARPTVVKVRPAAGERGDRGGFRPFGLPDATTALPVITAPPPPGTRRPCETRPERVGYESYNRRENSIVKFASRQTTAENPFRVGRPTTFFVFVSLGPQFF